MGIYYQSTLGNAAVYQESQITLHATVQYWCLFLTVAIPCQNNSNATVTVSLLLYVGCSCFSQTICSPDICASVQNFSRSLIHLSMS